MKKRIISMMLACVMCLCLVPVAAFAAEWYQVGSYYLKYLGSSQPPIETREITVDGMVREVTVYPVGTRFESFNGLYISNVECYVNDEFSFFSSEELATTGLPAQGVLKMPLYGSLGWEGDIWITAEGSGTSVDPTEPDEPDEPADITFTDVTDDMYYAEPVAWAVEQSITSGTSDTTFSPNETCTRAQIITFLWRAAGSPEPEKSAAFTDVKADTYYAKATDWAAENGMASGETFSPDAPCTRLMAVEFMWKHAGSPSAAAANFSDVSSNAVNWAVDAGVTSGTSDTTFSPNETCTRAQIVTFLYRAFAK